MPGHNYNEEPRQSSTGTPNSRLPDLGSIKTTLGPVHEHRMGAVIARTPVAGKVVR